MQVFRTYVFDANDNSFCVPMLQSDWMRFQSEMSWSLWNHYTIKTTMLAVMSPIVAPINSSFIASGCSIANTYPSTLASEAISDGQQQADSQVGQINVIDQHHYSFVTSASQVFLRLPPCTTAGIQLSLLLKKSR